VWTLPKLPHWRGFLTQENAVVDVIAPILGTVQGKNGGQVAVNQSFLTTDAVLYDAVLVPDGSANFSASLVDLGDAVLWINEAYRHCKAIGAIGAGIQLMDASAITAVNFASQNSSNIVNKLGVVTAGNAANVNSFLTQFSNDLAQYRFWDRETLDTSKIPAP